MRVGYCPAIQGRRESEELRAGLTLARAGECRFCGRQEPDLHAHFFLRCSAHQEQRFRVFDKGLLEKGLEPDRMSPEQLFQEPMADIISFIEEVLFQKVECEGIVPP